MQIIKLTFHSHEDAKGNLVALEELKDIPFHIKRIYYEYNIDVDATRGCHAHKTLQQVLICVHGSCRIKLDDGRERETIELDKPNEGLYVSSSIWREMTDFSPGTVLLVLASELYDEDDYIRDYDAFLRFVNGESDG